MRETQGDAVMNARDATLDQTRNAASSRCFDDDR